MKELDGKFNRGLTLIYGNGNSYMAKAKLLLPAISNYLEKGKVCIISSDARYTLYLSYIKSKALEKLFFFNPLDYKTMHSTLDCIETIIKNKDLKLIVVDTISTLYRLELADIRGLGKIMARLEMISQKIPIILISNTYKNFVTDKEQLYASNLLHYSCKTVIKIDKKNVTKVKPIKESAIVA